MNYFCKEPPFPIFADRGGTCLQKEYCPPLDTALLIAIISDYDLSSNDVIDELRTTLDILKENTVANDDSFFDPSGSSGIEVQKDGSTQGSPDRAQSWHGDVTSVSEETDLTDISQTLNINGVNENLDNEVQEPEAARRIQYGEYQETLSCENKIAVLKEMFPTMKEFDINFTLKKFRNDWGNAVEELLNQVFFVEEGVNGQHIVKKGIDGFSDTTNGTRGRKTKGKRRKANRRTSSTPAPLANESDIDSSSQPSRWDRAKADVDFIRQRTYLTSQAITSTYHKSGASLPTTVAALCATADSHNNPYVSETSPALLDAHICEISLEYPALPLPQLTALIQLTHPSTASARELARALCSSPSSTSFSSTRITPHYLPRPASPPSPPQTPSSTLTSPLALHAATALAHASTNARSTALAQASAAYRKSKSNPLMSGAASYYSSIGRDAAASLNQYEAAAADALVAKQSKMGEVDLHGVAVKDAVRIARERVEGWWGSSAQEWARGGKVMQGEGLRVVTGVGRHSEGGRGRLGPAVGGMLVREGWKIEVGEGLVVVVGRARRYG